MKTVTELIEVLLIDHRTVLKLVLILGDEREELSIETMKSFLDLPTVVLSHVLHYLTPGIVVEHTAVKFNGHCFLQLGSGYEIFPVLLNFLIEVVLEDLLNHRWQMLLNGSYLGRVEIDSVSDFVDGESLLLDFWQHFIVNEVLEVFDLYK